MELETINGDDRRLLVNRIFVPRATLGIEMFLLRRGV